MKKVLLVFVACLGIVSCKQGTQNKKEEVQAQNSSEQVVDMHNAANALSYYGVYEGVIPAADCPGIEVVLTLNLDQTFALHETYIDREDGVFEEKGSFAVDGNHLILFKSHDEESSYKIEEGRLKMLNSAGEEITGDLASHYILQQKQVFEE